MKSIEISSVTPGKWYYKVQTSSPWLTKPFSEVDEKITNRTGLDRVSSHDEFDTKIITWSKLITSYAKLILLKNKYSQKFCREVVDVSIVQLAENYVDFSGNTSF